MGRCPFISVLAGIYGKTQIKRFYLIQIIYFLFTERNVSINRGEQKLLQPSCMAGPGGLDITIRKEI